MGLLQAVQELEEVLRRHVLVCLVLRLDVDICVQACLAGEEDNRAE